MPAIDDAGERRAVELVREPGLFELAGRHGGQDTETIAALCELLEPAGHAVVGQRLDIGRAARQIGSLECRVLSRGDRVQHAEVEPLAQLAAQLRRAQDRRALGHVGIRRVVGEAARRRVPDAVDRLPGRSVADARGRRLLSSGEPASA